MTVSGSQPNSLAAKAMRRSLIVWHAAWAAMPFRSLPEEAAVAEVLGTLSVRVAVIFTLSSGTWNSWATTWATLIFSP